MKIIVSFSGGKDSQACLIQATNKYGADKIEAVFCDTGWEHPETYQHISDVCKQLDVKLVVLRSKKYTDFVDMSIKRSRFPSSQRRFCTSELKIKPMIDYILSLTEPCVIIQGIRAKESEERAKLPYECNYFGEYYERIKKNRKGKIVEVWKQDYRRKDVLKWCEHYDASVSRPIFQWSAQEVINHILSAGQKPNPLYSRGFSRVGCYPCIMCRKQEVKLISQEEFRRNRLIDAEQRMKEETPKGSSFFSPSYIPNRFCKNRTYPTVQEVFEYVNRNNVGMDDMFEPEGGYSCMSLYHGLCE